MHACGIDHPDILVIGIGNPLRGDDGVGWDVTRRLGGLPVGRRTCVRFVPQLTPELVELTSGALLVIFIDASVADPPGLIRCQCVAEDAGDRPVPDLLMYHTFSPSGFLGLGRRLYGRGPRAYVISVGGRSFGYLEGLSPQVADAVPEVTRRVLDLINWWNGRAAACPDVEPSPAASFA